jgi:DNA-binding response OmpR family regulator
MEESAKERILVVEDERAILMGLKDNLEMEGYEVLTAVDGDTGLKLALQEDPDLIVLDIMLPKMDGFEVCKRLRQNRIRGSIIMLTAKQQQMDKLEGFKRGADDYITKPFSILELLARVKAVLRRTKRLSKKLVEFRFGDVEIDFEKFEAVKGGEPIKLTPREFKILKYFILNAGRVISRNELLDKVWGYDVFPTTRTVDNHIVKLRKQIEDDPANPTFITSIRGVGYKFECETPPE